VLREESLGATYAVVRRESDGKVVRVWISPDSLLRYQIPWGSVNVARTYSVGVVASIPLDDEHPWPGQLARRFDGTDDRIFAYDGAAKVWRLVPDLGTLQSLGLHWCDISSADGGFMARLRPGDPYPSAGTPARSDYPSCVPDGERRSTPAGGVTSADGGPTFASLRDLSGTTSPEASISRLSTWGGYAVMATDDDVLQWRPEAGDSGAFWRANTLDELSTRGLDGWLARAHGIPAACDNATTAGLSFDALATLHLTQILDGKTLRGEWVAGFEGNTDAVQALASARSQFFSSPDWIERYGLPVGVGLSSQTVVSWNRPGRELPDRPHGTA
jgi:hypothetical protein